MTRAEREREIQSFAESQGWTAAIVEGGLRHEGNISNAGPSVAGSEFRQNIALGRDNAQRVLLELGLRLRG
jgi:hypothetical protein